MVIIWIQKRRDEKQMRYDTLDWKSGKVIRKRKANTRMLAGVAASTAALYVGADLGVAKALEPLKVIVAECSDPVCFIGGSIGLYRVGIGDREEGFKQILNATLAQVGFYVWPKVQVAIRTGMGG